jgi:hypothetical protein
MAASIVIEEDSGTYAGHVLPHRGYYAGDFGSFPSHPAPHASWSSDRSGSAQASSTGSVR